MAIPKLVFDVPAGVDVHAPPEKIELELSYDRVTLYRPSPVAQAGLLGLCGSIVYKLLEAVPVPDNKPIDSRVKLAPAKLDEATKTVVILYASTLRCAPGNLDDDVVKNAARDMRRLVNDDDALKLYTALLVYSGLISALEKQFGAFA